MAFVSHPRILPERIEERRYQMSMALTCLEQNTLLILPTGLGKTVVALYVAAETLDKGGKVLMLAPTKPLVDQHRSTMSEMLEGADIAAMNGNMRPETRRKVIMENDVIVSTPQAVANDLEAGRYGLDGIGLIVFDEAHRGVGNYAYVTVAAHNPGCRTMGMTASPGSDPEKIKEVCRNLGLTHIELRSEDDPDVSPYVHDVYINRVEVNMPKDLTDVIGLLRSMLDQYVRELTQLRLMDPNWPASTKHLLVVGQNLQARLSRGQKTPTVFRGLTVQAVCMKLMHALNLAETQGMSSLRAYLEKLDREGGISQASKGSKELIGRPEYRALSDIVRSTNVEHPKVSRAMSLVSQVLSSRNGSKVIVFSQYRDTCDLLVDRLSKIDGARVGKLIGQSNGGLRQKEQVELLEMFRSGEYNVIVSTSVGEEGLDVTSTDAVIFYEPVPSEIRTIQRRGRTGRMNDGDVYVLVAKGTMDEVFESTSKKREEQMRSRMERLNREISRERTADKEQHSLADFR
ncbi:MAG: helicase-related protein [Candidatus Methanomethylophilaceae archaeon]|jgi:Fanconi anemia group M protein|nr:helicase-related protein [Candidatus Methanomethylophilaceae archaeon]NLF33637.1 DEAD/DEAH box helicase family protein [Thermoplasmatales archaeon]